VLDVSTLFYMAFDYIPRLERDVDKGYKRISYLTRIKAKGIEEIPQQDIEEAIASNKRLIRAYTTHRLFKVYLPLFLLAIPLLVMPLSIVCPAYIFPAEIAGRLWSLMLFFGMGIPFCTAVGTMLRNRPYTKFENIHRKVLLEMTQNARDQ